jgi:ribosome-associated protein
MSRKPKRGYYVKGHFVAEGSELDLELKREAKGFTDVSKTDLKRESDRLQALGEALLTLRVDLSARIDLPDTLIEAVAEARRITNFEGRRRQMQYIGKLMRKLDERVVQDIEAALEEQRKPSAQETLRLHQAEDWRDRLIADDAALNDWLAQRGEAGDPADLQQLRALIRQARKDAATAKPEHSGEAQRHGKAYREIFQWVKGALARADGDEPTDDNSDHE